MLRRRKLSAVRPGRLPSEGLRTPRERLPEGLPALLGEAPVGGRLACKSEKGVEDSSTTLDLITGLLGKQRVVAFMSHCTAGGD